MEQAGRYDSRAVQKETLRGSRNPRIEANKLRELPDCYKVKLKSAGYRLIYQVIDHEIVVFVVAIGKREREAAYDAALDRLSSQP